MAKSNISVFDDSLLSYVNGHTPALELYNVAHTKSSLDFKPKTKYNIGYIVAAVLFNDKDEVLLIQEAKPSCRGLWYLPAGRVEPGESLQQGVQREVEEEAGLQFKPVSLVTIEVQTASWYRFTFTGTVTGGELKTEEMADQESLQAAWFPYNLVVNPQMGGLYLRSHDIIPLVQKTKLHHQMSQPHKSMPLLVHHNHIVLRLLMVYPSSDSQCLWYLRQASKSLVLPSVVVTPFEKRLDEMATRLIHSELASNVAGSICGLLNVEFCPVKGKPDGLCINVLYLIDNRGDKPPKVQNHNKYVWEEVKKPELQEVIKGKLRENGTVIVL